MKTLYESILDDDDSTIKGIYMQDHRAQQKILMNIFQREFRDATKIYPHHISFNNFQTQSLTVQRLKLIAEEFATNIHKHSDSKKFIKDIKITKSYSNDYGTNNILLTLNILDGGKITFEFRKKILNDSYLYGKKFYSVVVKIIDHREKIVDMTDYLNNNKYYKK